AVAGLVPAAVLAQGSAGAGATGSGSGSASGSASGAARSAADAQADARIEAALEQALEVGIPVTMLESKIAEGKAKGVSMTRIATAVEHRLEVLTEARAAMGGAAAEASASTMAAAAFALEKGARAEDVKDVSQTSPPEQRTIALAVLGELVAEGKSSASAAAEVRSALERNLDLAAELSSETRAEIRLGRGDEPSQPGSGTQGGGSVSAGAEVRGSGTIQAGLPGASVGAQLIGQGKVVGVVKGGSRQ
ncbi:MAG: hypothetical protein HY703_08455, partial [Gemmatimonadetes bacterium]|nr:hypothetical protein [Gemmatimonadota bacterium]